MSLVPLLAGLTLILSAPTAAPRGLLIVGDLDPGSFRAIELPVGKPKPLFTADEIRRLSQQRGTNFVRVSAPRGGRVAVAQGAKLFLKSVRTPSMRPIENDSKREVLAVALDPSGSRIGVFLAAEWHLAAENTLVVGDLVVVDSRTGASRTVMKGIVQLMVSPGVAWNREGSALVASCVWPPTRAGEAVESTRRAGLTSPPPLSTRSFPLSGAASRALHPGEMGFPLVDSGGWLAPRPDGSWTEWPDVGSTPRIWAPPEEGARLLAGWKDGRALWWQSRGVSWQSGRGSRARLLMDAPPAMHVLFGN